MKFSSTELINFLFSEKASFMLDAHIVKLLALALNNLVLDLANLVTKWPNLALKLTKSGPGLTL